MFGFIHKKTMCYVTRITVEVYEVFPFQVWLHR